MPRLPRCRLPRPPFFRAWILGALALAGCSLGAPIARQAIDYNGTVEQAANALLVRNILRARDETPLHFTTVPQIRGSLNLGLGQPGLGLPLGGAGSTSGLVLGLGGGVSPSFDVSALDTQEFTRGLLEPLEPQVVRYYWERGYPEELLLILLFNAVQDPVTGRNQPNDPRCWLDRPDCPVAGSGAGLEEALRSTLALGPIIFHPYLALHPVGPPLSAAQAADPALLALAGEARMRLARLPDGRWQLEREEPRVAACRRVELGGRTVLLPVEGTGGATSPDRDAPVCVRAEMPAAELAAAPGRRAQRVEVRSVLDIIRFLGLLLRVQAGMPPRPDSGAPCLTFTVRAARPEAPARRACLLRLPRAGRDAPPARVAWTVEHDGATWLVPAYAEPPEDGAEPGDYSVRVLALLTELLNLKKSSTAIPTTRAVQVVR
ncbi:hypothetical protein [Paracraurococcus lichenis]|uniref:Lipoprotein n=1 Tax=Paracraurococcus lichenis TaxID=3064888 RepID=A0ABT9E3P0_9PROT|nr:hypothetical protein [Paracraurococcus sp. LOR1-02]MDO9710785.1 hypothetical protein [Paracraurococcus sp. LOR1-02]